MADEKKQIPYELYPEYTINSGRDAGAVRSARLEFAEGDIGMRSFVTLNGITYKRATNQKTLGRVTFFAGQKPEVGLLEL